MQEKYFFISATAVGVFFIFIGSWCFLTGIEMGVAHENKSVATCNVAISVMSLYLGLSVLNSVFTREK